MKIIMSGGTGLVGRLLIPKLIESGHEVDVLGRDEKKIRTLITGKVNAVTWDKLTILNPEEFDIIINLAGENISAHRWTTQMKQNLLLSRVNTTSQLIDWAARAPVKKPHLYNASAVGIYGLQTEMPLNNVGFNERNQPHDGLQPGFSSQLVTAWEAAAKRGEEAGIPVTLMRFGVVLKRGEGMLKKLALPAQCGMSAQIGSGEQPLAWIDSSDLVNAIIFLMTHPEMTGPVNLVAPQCVSQKIFNKSLAQVLKKPCFLRLPAWIIRLLFGQMGEELLLSGQAVVPQRLTELRFDFQYPDLCSALSKEFQ